MEALTDDSADLERHVRSELADANSKTNELSPNLLSLCAQLGWDSFKIGHVRRTEKKREALRAKVGKLDDRRAWAQTCQAALEAAAPELLALIAKAEQAQSQLDELQARRDTANRELDEATEAKASLLKSTEYLTDHDLDRLRSVRDEHADTMQEFSQTKSGIEMCQRVEKLTADDLMNYNLRDGLGRFFGIRISGTSIDEIKRLAQERLPELRERYKALKEIVDQRDHESEQVMLSNLR